MFNQLRGKLASFSFQLSTTPDRLVLWQNILLGIFVFFACFYGMSSYAILDMNEGLYAQVAQEMITGGHWIIPHLNGVPYLEKPPLFYWLLALSYKAFGVNAFAARLVPSLAFALTALMMLVVGKKISAIRTGFIASFILLSSLIFIMIGRTVFFDMLLTYFVAGSLFSFYFWIQEKDNAQLYLGYIFLALAVLTKGFLPLILIAGIIFIYFILMQSERSVYKEIVNKKALIIFLAIALPWHILAMLALPSFTWEYFVNNQILRFFNVRIPDDFHNGPIYYYIPRVIAYLLPWSIFLPAIFWPFKLRRPFDPLKAFLWTWFLVMFLFFSLSGDKGDYYMVIGIVPLAFLIAQKIETWFVESNARWLNLGFYGLMAVLIGAGAVALLLFSGPHTDYVSQFSGDKIPNILLSSVLFLVMFFIAYGIAGFYFIRKNSSMPVFSFLLIAGLMIPMVIFYLSVREKSQFMYSQIAPSHYILAQYEHRPLYLYKDFEAISSLVFYTREPAIIIDSESADLYFGSHTKAAKGKFISMADFLNQIKHAKAFVALKVSKLADFQKQAGKDTFCVIQRNGNVLLLSNAADDCKGTLDQGTKKSLNVEEFNLGKDSADMPKDIQ